ncbi:MAG TPA: polysaccharide deacetylase family protein [Verrucomicrobiae bacterium]
MAFRKQDWSVLALYALGFSRVRNALERFRKRPIVRFLAFHDLPESAIEAFKAKLKFLKENTNVIDISDYFSCRLSVDRLNIVITFDDGYKSWRLHAAPALRQLQLPATFFISSGFLNLQGTELSDFTHLRLRIKNLTTGPLCDHDVRELAEMGFTIGGHTYHHVNLCEYTDESGVIDELATDKGNLESLTGHKVNYFAYPFGAFQNSVINLPALVARAGFGGAVTTISGVNDPAMNPFLLNRELTDASMPLTVFKARVFGNQDGVRLLKEIIAKRPRSKARLP